MSLIISSAKSVSPHSIKNFGLSGNMYKPIPKTKLENKKINNNDNIGSIQHKPGQSTYRNE